MIDEVSKLLLTCTFKVFATSALTPHGEFPSIDNSSPPLVIRYLVERENEIGTMMGNLSPVDVTVLWGNGSVTLFEFTPNGTPTVTTVDMRRGKPLPAVHSRHTIIDGLVPSQYYGECKVQ